MRPERPHSAPLPVALLALSVAVCLSASAQPAGSASATPGCTRGAAEQRQTLEHLIAALTDAARSFSQKIESPAQSQSTAALIASETAPPSLTISKTRACPPQPLRESLLNLPPPARG
ncbi:MAG: hypothetical protein AAGC44_03410 [Planctomycetota bacterium]